MLPLSFSLLALGASALIVDQFVHPNTLTGTSFGIPGRNATYDYVIVGGGLAGSVVASRLTENSSVSVALLEAGNFYELSNGNWSQIPYWSEQWVGAEDWQPLVDWGLFTTPQINGKSIHYCQGKGLGGSSGINQMLYHRPTIGAYEAWADLVGDQSYTWANMTPFFEKSMTFSPNSEPRAENATANYTLSAFSEKGGPLHVSFPAYAQPIGSYGPAAFSSIGMTATDSFSSGILNGYGYIEFTVDPKTGLRSSSESTFLRESMGRPGLTVYVNAMARNLIFENNTAVGVNVTSYGMRPFTISARKEVIVSAGAYLSPQLLMVSGIGPRQTLEQFNIPIVSALEGVGQNMWDTCNIGGVSHEVNLLSYSTWQEPERMAIAANLLLTNGTGPLTNSGADFLAWEKIPSEMRANFSAEVEQELAQFPADWPEVEYILSGSGTALTSVYSTKQYASVGILQVARTSRGNMTIQSADNMDPPIINPNWLQSEADQQVAIQAIKRARMVWEAIPVKIGEEYAPGPNVTTDEEILEYVKSSIAPIHHVAASCAMGKVGNPQTVVDSHARVIGVNNLRVIDASSLPFTTPGHTQAATYAHAEKLVQDIIDGWSG